MTELAGDMVEVDHHRCHQRGHREALPDTGTERPQDDQGGEDMRSLVEQSARDYRTAGAPKCPIGGDKAHRGSREGAR